ncbi:MAG: DNA-directed RNA polymerase subunit K [Candidatus Diapherotrites archaeon]|uniref:DNA-directed RNA polymerase subunit Rpo6 n=1 Tax=Candidatus Iainarchaeum sp. TaxID=3101447 RepID=A0A8T4C671_9ARCH|nr:DNA-directed RNA polymerase subunit K [Candidatus Diapherotrites archaeon]
MTTITRFEQTRIIGARALQLAFGAPALLENKKVLSPYELAKAEFDEKVIPLSVIRNLPNGQFIRIEVN